MLDALDLRKSYGGQTVLDGASFQLGDGERWALVGPNGAGKTTLLRILAREEAPDGGEVRRRRGLEVGYLRQEQEAETEQALLSYVEDVAQDVRHLRSELRALEAALGAGDSDPKTIARYGHLQTRFEHLGGYALKASAERILEGLGFSASDFGSPLASFSGGWRMRAALGRILLREPDLVLLDEPTNHLDIVTLEWLEAHLRESPSAYLIVSHDVAFLDRVAQGVLALEAGRVVRTKGPFAQYRAERRLRAEQARAARQNWERRRAETEAFAERFRYKATKARQVQARLRQLDKDEAPPPPPADDAVLQISLPQPERSGRHVASLEDVVAGYEGRTVYRGLNLRIDRGEKVVLIGPNGAGKSTLLKLLAGALAPGEGRVVFGHNVGVSYFAQHQLEQLDPRNTVLGEMQRLPGYRGELELRSVLGAFLFSGDAVEKPVAVLSGGERSRLVLAKLLAAPGNFFLLDEPTNHLDLQACEVLKQALEAFSGTLCLITHDRDLIDRVATKLLWVEAGRVEEFLGNYTDLLAKRVGPGAREAPGRPAASAEAKDVSRPARKDIRRREAEKRETLRREVGPLRSRVERLESEIGETERRLAQVEASLAVPETYGDPGRAAALARERSDLGRVVEALTADWEQAATELEEREAALRAQLEETP